MLENLTLLPTSAPTNPSFFLMYGEIDTVIAQQFAEWILTNNLAAPEERPDTLTVFVNSIGGDLNAAWSIIDFMRGSSIPVITVGVGIISSCGILIFMGGQKGNRLITDNTSILSHQFSWGNYGKHHELMAINKEYTNVQNRLMNYIQKCTDLSLEDIERKMMPPSDTWFTAEEAVTLGVADRVYSLK